MGKGTKGVRAETIRERLERARAEQTLVRVSRRIRRADVVEGYVVGVGSKWTLLAPIVDYHLDGWTAVRTRDIRRVQPEEQGPAVARFLEGRGRWPVQAPSAVHRLGSTRALLEDAVSSGLALSLHVERDDPDSMYVGVVVAHKRRRVTMVEVSPRAVWEDAVSRWSFREITRIDLGARYETAVCEAAGPPPAT